MADVKPVWSLYRSVCYIVKMGDLKSELRNKVLTYVGGGFGLVAGLAWNDAIKEFIQYAFPLATDTLTAKFVYAGLITIVVVVIITYLERIFKSEEKENL